MNLYLKSISELSKMLDDKKISSYELTEYFLNRIKKYNKKINAFISIDENKSMEFAKIADIDIRNKNKNILTGIPIAHKDLFCTKDFLTTCGSKMLSNFKPPYDATVVKKLANKGMVPLGKTNMDEFAMGSTNETSFFGSVKNPWDFSRVPGGSSGGSAAAVASGMVTVSSGSDTGGSIRQPAAFCGLTGLKPTYGTVSRYGMIAYASSLDQGGVLARNAKDCAIIYDSIRGFDPNDSTTHNKEYNFSSKLYLDKDSAKDYSIGIPTNFIQNNLSSSLSKYFDIFIEDLKKLGFKIKDVELPIDKITIPAYYIIASSEASSNLSRYDGVKYGHRSQKAENLNELYFNSRTEGFGHEVKKRIMIGTFSLSSGYYDENYLLALKLRRKVCEEFKKIFNDVDFLICPSSTDVAFKLGDNDKTPIDIYLSDMFTTPVNLAGLPAVSLPTNFYKNLPVGMQIIGNHFEEEKILNLANLYQENSIWHKEFPGELS